MKRDKWWSSIIRFFGILFGFFICVERDKQNGFYRLTIQKGYKGISFIYSTSAFQGYIYKTKLGKK